MSNQGPEPLVLFLSLLLYLGFELSFRSMDFLADITLKETRMKFWIERSRLFCYSVIKVLCVLFLWHNFFIISYSEVFVKNFFDLFFKRLLLFLSNSSILSYPHLSVKHFFIFLLYLPNKSEKYYGEGGIWTLAPRERSTPLAGAPLQPLEYFSIMPK